MLRFKSAMRGIAFWSAPRSTPFDLIRIYALSALIGLFFLYFGNISVEHGAVDYIELARAIVSGDNVRAQNINGDQGRDIGMALIWLISGYPVTHSLVGVIVIQVLMGITMPLLVYLALCNWFPRAAYYTAIAVTLSLAPMLLSKFVHHDQPYIFFTIFSVYLINRYMLAQSPLNIYAVAISIFGLGLIRQVGTGVYWLLVPVMALRGGKKSYRHLALSAVLFVAVSMAYSQYRTNLIGDYGGGFGIQLFYNFFSNMSEYGLRFSPTLGPNTKFILDRLYECALPSPVQSSYFGGWTSPHDFLSRELYDKTAKQFVDRVSEHPDRFYYDLINSNCVESRPVALDQVLLGADWEIARAYPIYIARLFSRNALQLLYDPGWAHSNFSNDPEVRQRLSFPLGDGVSEQNQTLDDDRLTDFARSEALFIPMARQSHTLKQVYNAICLLWLRLYRQVTIALGCLTCFAWISTLIGLLQKIIGGPRLACLSKLWLSDHVVPASIGISALLLANVAITAICVDPMYRYDFSLLVLKIMLAGVGCTVAVELLKSIVRRVAPS